MSTLVQAFSRQLKNEDTKGRKKAIEKELESKDVSELLREIKKDDIFSLKDSRSNIGKYIELLKIITEFAEDHVNYQLINKDTFIGNDETYASWNEVMKATYNKLKHAEDNKHDSTLNNRLLTEEFLNDPEKMRELDEFHKSKKGGKKTVPKKQKTTVKMKSKMRKKTAKKHRK